MPFATEKQFTTDDRVKLTLIKNWASKSLLFNILSEYIRPVNQIMAKYKVCVAFVIIHTYLCSTAQINKSQYSFTTNVIESNMMEY